MQLKKFIIVVKAVSVKCVFVQVCHLLFFLLFATFMLCIYTVCAYMHKCMRVYLLPCGCTGPVVKWSKYATLHEEYSFAHYSLQGRHLQGHNIYTREHWLRVTYKIYEHFTLLCNSDVIQRDNKLSTFVESYWSFRDRIFVGYSKELG